jgi:TolB-like protein/Flp pilus assembly protein TadD
VSEARQLGIPHSAIRQQLECILNHGLFRRSERMARFLRVAVERTLDGKGDELKEYLIGVEVFDRKGPYDPRVDPIVRVEARRLRAKLKQYYEGDGAEDPVLIEFARGTYAPRFVLRREAPAPVEAASAAGVVTTAVLPFANLSPNPDNVYFSDGLTEELIHALTKVPGLRVVAWNTAAQMRDRSGDLTAIRQELKAGTVLTGSVRIAGARLRVRAQLIETSSGIYLWSETYDREMQEVFAIQEEIAGAIVQTLRVQLAGPPVRGRTSVSAYDWYLKGRYLMHRRTSDELKQSIECFDKAVTADPNSALAYAGVADAHSLCVDYGLIRPAEGFPRAKSAAERAIALDPELAEAHASLAFIRSLYDWDWDAAGRLYERAIALNHGYATAHHWYAVDFHANLGNFEKALAEIEIAVQLDPLSSIIREDRAYTYMLMRRYEEAVEGYREVLTFDPGFYKAYTAMGRAYGQLGRYEEAIAMLEKGRSLGGEIPNILGAMAQMYALAGEMERAHDLLTRLEELARDRYVPLTVFAVAWLGFGEKSRSLDYLEKACEQRESPVTVMKTHPVYDPLRGEPRFDALLRRVFGNSGRG